MQGRALPEGFRYVSDSNTDWLTKDQLSELVAIEKSQMTERLHTMS